MPHSVATNPARRRLAFLILSTGLLGLFSLPDNPFDSFHSTAHAAATFTVRSTSDGADSNTADGVCADGAGNCTLRAAIEQTNATPGTDTINFQIGSGVQTILLGAALPDITDPVVIDGTTQPGYAGTPLVEVVGRSDESPPQFFSCLHITAGGSTVRGLALVRCGSGILLGDTFAGSSAGGNRVESCYIGLRADGSPAVMRGHCVGILGSPDNIVGGTSAAERNVLSGCVRGVLVWGPSSTGNLIRGNYIGTNAAGTAAYPNSEGVSIQDASNNVVGGDTAAERNVISGNNGDGVSISGDGTLGLPAASGNVVKGNYIGTNAEGTAAIPNGQGVRIHGVNSVVGGLASSPGVAPGNLISGQVRNLFIQGSGTLVQGNLVGPNAAGTSGFGVDESFGIISVSKTAVIGGEQPGARNVISGNTTGIFLLGSTLDTPLAAVIRGNYIGTDPSGTAALGNSLAGIVVEPPGNPRERGIPAPGNVISGNLISGNSHGVLLRAGGVLVQDNLIGTDASGAAPLPNRGAGVYISRKGNNVVGGTAAGTGNRIAFNEGNGILLGGESVRIFSNGNRLRGNSIFSNGLLGIDLIAPGEPLTDIDVGGVTINDAGDADTGSNNLQNAPVVLSVNFGGGTMAVQGRLDAAPHQTYDVDFFASASCDPTGHGEGQVYLGSTPATTDAAGASSFSASFPAPSAPGQVITATATDAAGNTSEFSVCHEAGAPGTVQLIASSFHIEEPNLARIPITRTLGTAGAASVDYATSDGTATAGVDYTPVSGTLHFAPGETTKTLDISIFDDKLDENEETFQITLTNPTGGIALGAFGTSTVTLLDDDLPPVFSVVSVTMSEGDAGTTSMPITFKLLSPSGRPVRIDYKTRDGTAMSPGDFQPTSGTLIFNPGETVKQISVLVNGDDAPEEDETFSLEYILFDDAPATPGPGVIGAIWDDDSPDGIHFSAPSYTVSERDGTALIRARRRGDTSTPASIHYQATAFGLLDAESSVATSRGDFTYTAGTLHFAPGEAEQSFTVLVNDDAYVETPEAVLLFLSFPPGESHPERRSAMLVINSDDTVPANAANNPVDDTQFFVRQHYHDFLNREPDPAGFRFWVDAIEQCGTDAQCREVKRISVSAAFFLSIEFQQTGNRVFRFYRATFPESLQNFGEPERSDDFLEDTQEIGRGVVVGTDGWQERLRQNVQEFTLQWVRRAEFRARFPLSLTAAQFVDRLFFNSRVTPTPAERDAALAAYGAGDEAGRAAALLAVTDSASVFDRQYNTAFVYMEYVGYLRRNPNMAPDSNFQGFNFWLSKLDSFSLPGEDVSNDAVAFGRIQRAEMVKAFLSSDEYRRRFGR